MIARRLPLVIALALSLVSVASPVLAQQYRLHEISLGGPSSYVAAINEQGVAVGQGALPDGSQHAWYFAAGVVTDVGTFGGTYSYFTALNARGDAIGAAQDASGQQHAFAYRDGVRYKLTPMGFLQSHTIKINRAGQVIGYAFDGTRSVGFLATPTSLGYNIEVIQFQTTGQSYAYDLNDRGMVVGYATVAAGVYHPFLYDSATSDMRNLGTFGGTFGYAVDINEAGDVTGYAQNATSRSIAFLYLNATASKVPLEVPGNDSYGDRINDNGQVTVRAWDGTASHAYLYSAGQLRSIAPAGSYYSYMTGLTDRGDVFGTYAYTYVTRFSPYSCGPFATCYTEWREYSWRAFVYNGLTQPLSRANGTSYISSYNATGEAVVGMNNTTVELWNGSLSGPINLPNAVSASVSSRGLNNHGAFVATSSSGRAFLYRDGSVVDLNDLVSRPDATLQTAHVFTDSGHNGGTGVFDGVQKAYVLLELFDTDGDGVVDDDDNCPAVVNDQSDWDQNSIGDACDVNVLPVAVFVYSEAKMGQPISFDATTSTDVDGDITRYAWDFDYDGVNQAMVEGSELAMHEYASAGTFTVALRVTDDRGGAAFFVRQVFVAPVDQDPPVITLTSPLDGAVYAVGQSLTAQFACFDVATPVACSGTPTALSTSQPGTFAFTVTAQDGYGNVATRTATYTVRAGRERQWQQAAPLPGARSFAHAVTLDNGPVLVLGGFDAQLPSAQAWLYNSTSNRWSAVPDMSAARGDAAVVKLRDGRVLVSGGDSLGGRSAGAEIFNPATRGWTSVANMSVERSRHTLTVLSDGRVLATGGYLLHTDPYQAYQRSAEIYDPAADTWTRVGDMADRRVGHTASLLPDGRVLVVGGADYAEYKHTVEIFDAATNMFSAGTNLNERRYFHSAVTLPDGRILIAGGMNHFQVFSNALIYDPVTSQWQSAGVMSGKRVYFSMVMMADGRVLAAGGSTGQAATGAADVYNPVMGVWTAVLDLPIPRVLAAAAPLRDGGALIASGGAASVIDDVEIWNGARLIPQIVIPAVTSTGGQPVQVRVLTNVPGRPVTLTLGSTSYGPIGTGANGEVIFTNVSTVGFPSGLLPEALVASIEADEVTAEGRGIGSLTVTDSTPPLVTPNPEGAIHALGWYTSDVSLTWSVFDTDSPVTSSTGCAATSVNEDTAGVTFTCSATSAGGTSTVAFTIKRDTTAPAIASPLDGATFERGASIPMSLVCSDVLNEPTTCTSAGAFLDTSTVGARSFTVTGTDAVGNQAQQISSYFVAPPTNAFLWTKLPASTSQPGPRYGHGMVYDTQRKKTILIGGMAQDGTLLNDVWERDSATGVWIQVTPPLGAGPEPFPRHTFGIAYDEDRGVVIMYAGRVAPQYSNVRTNGDTWEWNPGTRAWRQIGTATPIVTAGLIEPSLAWDPVGHRVILFGGRPYYGIPHNAMTYAFNGTTWVQIAHQGPEGRARAAMSTDSRRGRVVLHGGWNRNEAGQWWTLTDTWEWDGSRWVQMNEAGDLAPPYRSSPALAYDAERGVTVLFGGTDGLFLQLLKNDTWEWNGRTWRSRETTGNPSRRVTAMVYDVDARQLVMVGGNGASGDPNYDFLGHGALGDIFVGSGYETITSSLVPQPASALFGADLMLRAGLVGRGGAPIIGRAVGFDLDGDGTDETSSMTDANGLASVVIAAAVVDAKYGSDGGEFTYAVNHVGDGIYEPSRATGTVTIVAPDRTPPVLPALPNLLVEATGPAGAMAEWGSLTAIDDLDGTVAVTCTPASGTIFPIGTTPVGCHAADAAGNRGENDFTVVVVDTTAPAVLIAQPNADILLFSVTAQPFYVDVSDAVGATTVSVNGLAARLVSGTPQSGRWTVDVPIALPVPSGGALRFTAQASDAAGNAAATPTLVVDNDGIAGEMDLRLSDGADQSQLFSNEFFYRLTPGTIERNGWAVKLLAVFDIVDISAQQAGPAGSFARVWICGGSQKELRLDRVGENAQVTCSTLQGPGSVRVRAVSARPTIELSKLVTATSGWLRPRTYTYWTSTAVRTGQTITTGSPLVADPENTEAITVTLVQIHEDGTELAVGTLVLDPGESADVGFVEGAEGEDDRAEIVGLAGDVEVVLGGQTFHVAAGETHVAVVDRTAPSIGESETLVVEASSAQGAVVTFALPVVVDAGDPAPHVSASPASGSTFALGETIVTVTARDAAGNVSTATFKVTVLKATPVISWPPPSAITFGTALSATQLNATASVAGSFVYTPGVGTVLSAGPAQPLSVTFTPTDTVTYTEATASVPITVTVPAILSVGDVSLTEGNLAGAIKQAWLTVKLTQKSSEWVSVSYTTSDGSAFKHVDYFAESSTLLFAPGVVTQSVAIPIVQDTVGESTESFFVDFSGVVDGRLGEARATITIVNDDSSSQVFTSIDDFSAGVLGGGAYLSETGDGELMLAPQGSEFSGASLPEDWISTPLVADASATVANGSLTIDGAALVGPSETGAGPTLEFAATFTASPDQSVGFGTSAAPASPMAMFIVRSSDRQLYVRTINGTRMLETPIAGIDWLGKPHRYQIVWTTTGTVRYYVDGTLMSSHTSMAWGAVTMRPVMIDSTAGDGALAVDWIRMTPYPGSGSYTSAVFDATETVLWQKLRTTSTIPSGTTSTITYRTGNTPSPDGSWTSLSPLGVGGVLTGSSRYVQFAIEMTTSSGAKTPVIQEVTVQFKR